MALKVKRAGADEYGSRIKVLLAGDPGSGKTRLSSTFPNVFYANAEGGLMSVVDRQPAYADINSSAELNELLGHLRQSPKVRTANLGVTVDTVVLDTLDQVQKILIEERKAEQRKDTLAIADWGWLGDQLRLVVRNFRNLDLNVIFTCHVKTDSDAESGQTFIRPGLQGAMGDEIPAYVDLAVLLRAAPINKIGPDGTTVRVLQRTMQTAPDLRHPWLKDRSGKLPIEFEVDLTSDYKRMRELMFGAAVPASQEVQEVQQLAPATPVKAEAKPEPAKEAAKATKSRPKPEPAQEEQPAAPTLLTVADEPTAEEVVSTNGDGHVAEDSVPPRSPTPPAEAAPTPPSETVTEVVGNGYGLCEQCGDPIESDDQLDLSRIRFRKALDRKCFLAIKGAKK